MVESSKAADVCGSGDFAIKLQLIERFGRNCFGEDGVKAIGQWPEDHVRKENREGKHKCQMKRTEPSKCADSGGTTDRGSRIEPTHACAILEDDPCAEKAQSAPAQRPRLSYLHPLDSRTDGSHPPAGQSVLRRPRVLRPSNSKRRYPREHRGHQQLPERQLSAQRSSQEHFDSARRRPTQTARHCTQDRFSSH